jgi:hypothetical protein
VASTGGTGGDDTTRPLTGGTGGRRTAPTGGTEGGGGEATGGLVASGGRTTAGAGGTGGTSGTATGGFVGDGGEPTGGTLPLGGHPGEGGVAGVPQGGVAGVPQGGVAGVPQGGVAGTPTDGTGGSPGSEHHCGLVGPFTVTCGDLNADRIVDIVDALLLAQFLAGEQVAVWHATMDANCDGVIDDHDQQRIADHYVDLAPIDCPPYVQDRPYCGVQDPAPFEVACGDVNNDGTIDAIDALLVAAFVDGDDPAIYHEAADADCSGAIDDADANAITDFYVGSTSELGCAPRGR